MGQKQITKIKYIYFLLILSFIGNFISAVRVKAKKIDKEAKKVIKRIKEINKQIEAEKKSIKSGLKSCNEDCKKKYESSYNHEFDANICHLSCDAIWNEEDHYLLKNSSYIKKVDPSLELEKKFIYENGAIPTEDELTKMEEKEVMSGNHD